MTMSGEDPLDTTLLALLVAMYSSTVPLIHRNVETRSRPTAAMLNHMKYCEREGE